LNFLEKYNTYSIAEVYKIYLKLFDFEHLSVRKAVYGISLDAICVKYQLNKKVVSSKIGEGLSLLEALDYGLLKTPIIPNAVAKKIMEIAPQIKAVSTESQMESLRKFYCLDSLTYRYVLFYAKRYHEIEKAIKVYENVYLLEFGWEEQYGEEIQHLHASSKNFAKDYQKLQRRAQKELLEQMNLTERELLNYYQNYYDCYQKNVQNDETYWTYSPMKAYLSRKK